jgi:hypothetical protein
MLSATTAILVSALLGAVGSRAPLASTYEEAACEEEAAHSLNAPGHGSLDRRSLPGGMGLAGEDCAPPTTVDLCSGPMSLWVAETIGSCDMPKVSSGAAIARARERDARDDRSSSRFCDGARCDQPSSPMRAAPRLSDDGSVFLLNRALAEVILESTPLAREASFLPESTPPHRLERPPRG